jgi:prepilin signal peptidase PulO-like enzyme (type II secretory pathway)
MSGIESFPLHLATSVAVYVAGSAAGWVVNINAWRLARDKAPLPWPGPLEKAVRWRFPLVEMLCGLLFLLVYLRYGATVATPVYMAFAAGLLLVTVTDLTHLVVPFEVTLPGILLGLGCAVLQSFWPGAGFQVVGGQAPWLAALIGIEAGGGVIFLLDKAARVFLRKPGMGGGDIWLMGMVGAFFGWIGVYFTLSLGAFIGVAMGLAAIAFAGRETNGPDEADEDDEAAAPGQEPVDLGDLYGFPGTILITAAIHTGAMLTGRLAEEEPDDEDEEEFTVANRYIPFAPSLCLAALIVLFFGQEIYTRYFALPG